MTTMADLENKIESLEVRLKKLEEILLSEDYKNKEALMHALYTKARELVIKHNKATVMFLQLKLLIDFQRASELMKKLEEDGVVSTPVKGEPRKVLAK